MQLLCLFHQQSKTLFLSLVEVEKLIFVEAAEKSVQETGKWFVLSVTVRSKMGKSVIANLCQSFSTVNLRPEPRKAS